MEEAKQALVEAVMKFEVWTARIPFHNADPWMRWAGVYERWHWRVW